MSTSTPKSTDTVVFECLTVTTRRGGGEGKCAGHQAHAPERQRCIAVKRCGERKMRRRDATVLGRNRRAPVAESGRVSTTTTTPRPPSAINVHMNGSRGCVLPSPATGVVLPMRAKPVTAVCVCETVTRLIFCDVLDPDEPDPPVAADGVRSRHQTAGASRCCRSHCLMSFAVLSHISAAGGRSACPRDPQPPASPHVPLLMRAHPALAGRKSPPTLLIATHKPIRDRQRGSKRTRTPTPTPTSASKGKG